MAGRIALYMDCWQMPICITIVAKNAKNIVAW